MCSLYFRVLIILVLGLFICNHSSFALSPSESPFLPPKTCQPCHTEIYDQWKDSPMANALRTPQMKTAMENYTADMTALPSFYYGDILCIGCHFPETMYDFENYGKARAEYIRNKIIAGNIVMGDPVVGGLNDNLSLEDGEAGITCHHCHSINQIDESSFVVLPKILGFNIDSTPGTDPGKLANSTMLGPYRDASTLAPHGAEFSETHTRSEFCRVCHDFHLPIGDNMSAAFGMTAPEAFSYVFKLYRDGDYTDDFAKVFDPAFPVTKGPTDLGTNTFWTRCCTTHANLTLSSYGEAGIQCQDCHMRPFAGKAAQIPGEPEREQVFTHYFPGPRRRAVGIGLEDAISTTIDANFLNSILTINITTTNIGAAHRIPNGCPLEVSALVVVPYIFAIQEVSPGRFERVAEVKIPGVGSPQYVVTRGFETFDNELFRYDKLMRTPDKPQHEWTVFGVQHDTGIFPTGSIQGPNSDTRSIKFDLSGVDLSGVDPCLFEIVVVYYYRHPGNPVSFDYDPATFEFEILSPDRTVIRSVRLCDIFSGTTKVNSRKDFKDMLYEEAAKCNVTKIKRAENPE